MSTSTKEGLRLLTGLCQILPIFAAVIHQDSDFIFGDIVKDMVSLSRRVADDLLDSETEISSTQRVAIISFAAEVGGYQTMSRALYLLDREKNPELRKMIVSSLENYAPIEKFWLPMLLAQIKGHIKNPEDKDVADLLMKSYEKIVQNAFGEDD